MGRLNLSSSALLAGAMGQLEFYESVFPHAATWVLSIPLLLPWLMIYTISFCREPPCGPRAFRKILVLAMCWYTAATSRQKASIF